MEPNTTHTQTSTDPTDTAWHWPKIGAITGVVGLVILGLVFGPITFFAGWRTREAGRGMAGAALMILGFVDFILPALVFLQWQMAVMG